ncbi:PTS sugar transporter subunit IIA [Rhodopseudomonas sp. P2A-2r]|uniref:PTS sugar transporter subunit IIA n=1 Tax=Rhodopseudomonas sp. P2A-2r TaxID=2991972 RepID=UPI0022340143|nr:PTS sugar transporter subunit IIA [Rhodopseudomonas sp. P2A-2r]UZE46964.1 PTS sugar transporter subunit IIA [Rhodopseudomonas sp. P2A-2r]
MRVNEFLSPVDVSINFRAAHHKLALLHGLARIIAKSTCVSANVIASGLEERERLGGTGTGNGVALPHARMSQLKEPVAHFARLERPIDYGAVDDLPVDLVFVLLLPDGAECRPLHALACVARKLRDEETLRLLRRASDTSGLYSVLTA